MHNLKLSDMTDKWRMDWYNDPFKDSKNVEYWKKQLEQREEEDLSDVVGQNEQLLAFAEKVNNYFNGGCGTAQELIDKLNDNKEADKVVPIKVTQEFIIDKDNLGKTIGGHFE